MNTIATVITDRQRPGHREAMDLAETEYERLLEAVGRLDADDWSRPTDCEAWDVKAMLYHVLAVMERWATWGELVRQVRLDLQASKRTGLPVADGMTARQVEEHSHLQPAEVARLLREMAPRALRGRRRVPAFLRALPIRPGPGFEGTPFGGTWRFDYLPDIIVTRDVWMHRVDLTRAVGHPLALSPEHDGRIVAEMVREWSIAHGQAFALILDGPAGGTFTHGEDGASYQLDAVEFCRILSGRGTGDGLLSYRIPF